MKSKNASESAAVYSKAKSATAAVPEPDSAPTDGKSIPIIVGAVRLTGNVIWIKTFLNSKNECRAHVAVCFGRNAFGRAISLLSLSQDGNYIYRRSGGKIVDPPSAVRFYDGTQTTADTMISSIEGSANTPAFAGYIYAVLENVKLGDFSAEFSDNGGTTIKYTTLACDSRLDDVELKYNDYTGLYYGLLHPKTGHCRIVTSDGCRIIRSAPIRLPYEFTWTGYACWSVPYSLSVVRCSNVVTITGYWEVDPALPGVDERTNYPFEWVVNPDTGQIVGGEKWLTCTYGDVRYLFDSLPGSIDIEIKAAFTLPSHGAGQFAVLRLLDRSNIGWEAVEGGSVKLGPESNLSGLLFDLSYSADFYNDNGNFEGTGRLYKGCIDIALVSRKTLHFPGSPSLGYWPDAGGYWVDQAPFLDDFIHLGNKFDRAELGGYRIFGTSLTAYRLGYTETGVITEATREIITTDGWGASGWTVSGMNYDLANDEFLISADPPTGSLVSPRIYKISASGVLSYVDTGLPDFSLMPVGYGFPSDGYAPVQNSDKSVLKKVNLATGEASTIYDGLAPTKQPVADLNRHTVSVPTVSGLTKAISEQGEVGDIALSDLLSDCCTFKGYDVADLEFQNLASATVKGLMINSTIRLSDLFNRLGSLFSFTFVETDRKLKFLKKRSGGSLAVDVYLTKDDLVLNESRGSSFVRTVQRDSSNNLLSGLDLEFMDPDKQYENSTIKIRRPVAAFDSGVSTRLETLSVPVSLPASDAYQIMYEAFYTMLRKLNRVSFAVPSWHARIEPGDCISVTVDGVETTGVAVRVTTDESFAQTIEMEVLDQGGETQISNPDTPADLTTDPAQGWYIPLEVPFLRPQDYSPSSTAAYYHGIACLNAEDWGWADLYMSLNGYDFTKILEYRNSPMTVARSTSAVGPEPLAFASDDQNSINIEVESGSTDDFVSISYLEQMNGGNLCVFGRPGRWEVISFRTVTDNGDGTLKLSGLQRGLRGTHMLYVAGQVDENHPEGDLLVLMDPTKFAVSQFPVAWGGRSEWFAIKTEGVEIGQGVAGAFDFQNIAMLSFQPQNVKATHVTGGSDLVVTWDEMTCIPCEWSDSGTATPMHASTEYDITIEMVGPTVTATVTGTSYTWADYATAFGADMPAPDVIHSVRVRPHVIGVGYGYEATGAIVESAA